MSTFYEISKETFFHIVYYYLRISSELTRAISKVEEIYTLIDELNAHGVQIFYDPRADRFFKPYQQPQGK
jgi:hypothetical protein